MGMLGQGPDLLVDDALVDFPPALTAVIAAEHSGLGGAGVETPWVVTVHEHRPSHGRVVIEGQPLRLVACPAPAGLEQPRVRADVEPAVRGHGVAPFPRASADDDVLPRDD